MGLEDGKVMSNSVMNSLATLNIKPCHCSSPLLLFWYLILGLVRIPVQLCIQYCVGLPGKIDFTQFSVDTYWDVENTCMTKSYWLLHLMSEIILSRSAVIPFFWGLLKSVMLLKDFFFFPL